jgi:hypothetical protein
VHDVGARPTAHWAYAADSPSAQINTKIAKEKDNGIAALRVRFAAASAEAESTASGDSNDSPSLLVSAAAD